MPARSKIMTLPRAERARLEAFIIERGFAGYAELADWLTERGHKISVTSLERHGSRLERRIEKIRLATEQAEALRDASPDDAFALAEASLRLAQQQIFDLMLAAEEGNLKELGTASKALAENVRALLAVHRDRQRILAGAAEAAGETVQRLGLSGDVEAAVRAAIQRAGRERA